ncbi:MAG TPA: CBS domain-containing protein [Myxococcales bacterium]|nr:CBS domain-containing protein [Myxococcales bacterium]
MSEFDEAFDDDERRVRGAILTEPVDRLMEGPPITVPVDATLQDAVKILQDKHIGCVLVVSADGKLAGIFTERDLLTKVVGKKLDYAKTRVADHMTAKPEALRADDKVAWALNKMHLGGFRHVPIVDGAGRPVGLLSVKDIVDFIVELFPAAVLNLPPEPTQLPTALDGG